METKMGIGDLKKQSDLDEIEAADALAALIRAQQAIRAADNELVARSINYEQAILRCTASRVAYLRKEVSDAE